MFFLWNDAIVIHNWIYSFNKLQTLFQVLYYCVKTLKYAYFIEFRPLNLLTFHIKDDAPYATARTFCASWDRPILDPRAARL